MKNLKKVLACVMAVATLGSITCIPINAQVDDTFTSTYVSISENDMENAIDVGIINIDGKKFLINARYEILGNVLVCELEDENFKSGLICDDLNAITNIIDAKPSEDGTYSIVLDREYCYQRIIYSSKTGEWTSVNEVVQKPLAEDEYLSPDGIRYRVENVDGETYVYDLKSKPVDCNFISGSDSEIVKYIVNTEQNVMYYMDKYHYKFTGWDKDGFPIIDYDKNFYDDTQITIMKNNGLTRYQAYNVSTELTQLDDTVKYNNFEDGNKVQSVYDKYTVNLTESQEDIQTVSTQTKLAKNPYNNQKYEIPAYYKVCGWFSSGQPILLDTFVPDYSDDVRSVNEDNITVITRNKYEIVEKTVDEKGITHVSYVDENYPNKVKTSTYGVKTYTLSNGEVVTSDKYGIFTDSNGRKYTTRGNSIGYGIYMIVDKNGELVVVGGSFGESCEEVDDVNDSNVIGESENKPITEFTVGDSTFPRGDINLDGKVNTVDLLMLKKYLLGLMEW